MSPQLENFVINVLSNVAFSILAILFAFLVSYVSFRSKRVKRLKVLNLEKSKTDIMLPILTAHLVIQKGEARLHDGTKSMHFEGSAVPIREIEAAYFFKEKLDLAFLDHIPDAFRNWLMKSYKGFNRINFDIRPAPLDIGVDKDKDRLVLIGGPEFNSLTDYFLKKADQFTIWDAPDCANPVIRRKVSGTRIEEIRPDSTDDNLGLVQRTTLNNGTQVVLFLVGVGTNGTLAAVHWFINNWENIDSMFGEKDFGVVLECVKRKVDPLGYTYAEVRKRFPDINGSSK